MRLSATSHSNETIFFRTGSALTGMNNQNYVGPHSDSLREEREHHFGLRWQAERDTAFEEVQENATTSHHAKAPSPLRSAGAVHILRFRRSSPEILFRGNLFRGEKRALPFS